MQSWLAQGWSLSEASGLLSATLLGKRARTSDIVDFEATQRIDAFEMHECAQTTQDLPLDNHSKVQ